jgi:nucleotide-binding universal stress UspA family protein
MPTDSLYKRIAVASTFSPRFEAVLAEAKRVRDHFGSALSLIHVGEPSEKTAGKFRDVLSRLQFPADSAVHYGQGDPGDVILKTVAAQQVDLLITGALEKEIVLRPFLGNVARRLVREANCSLFLFTKPEREPKPLRRIVFLTDYSELARRTFRQTLQLAQAESCERLYVIRIWTTFDEARAAMAKNEGKAAPRSGSFEEEERALEEFVLRAGETNVPIEVRCVRGNTGFAASDFVQSIQADLLVVPVENAPNSVERLPNQLAWITDVIPCNLWLVR